MCPSATIQQIDSKNLWYFIRDEWLLNVYPTGDFCFYQDLMSA